jgi:hypothetical protein
MCNKVVGFIYLIGTTRQYMQNIRIKGKTLAL